MPATRCCLLASHAAVAVTGHDARTFLQGQLSNDLLGLERHPGMLAASCNRQGRVLATMRLAADGDGVLLVLNAKLARTLVAQLATYVLRANVRFEDRSQQLLVAGLIDAEPDARWSQSAAAAVGLAMLVASPRRILLAGERQALDAALAAVPRTAPDDWERVTIADGEPSIMPATAALWTPQMLNLDLIGGVSFSKGCYVGQEVVSRMEHRGTARSRILPVTADAPLATGSVTSGSGRSLGRILSTADRRGLALIRLDRLAEAIEAGDPIRAGASAIKVEKPGWAHFAVPGAAAA